MVPFVDTVRLKLRSLVGALASGPWVRKLASDPWVTGGVYFLVGGVATSLWPQVVGVAVLVAIFAAVVMNRIKFLRERRLAEDYSAFEHALRQPDPDALARVHAANEHYLVFNRVIEVLPHHNLNSHTKFASLGWAPDDISVQFRDEFFDASEIIARVGGKKAYDLPNGRKFCLADRSLGGTDTDLSLCLRESDYFTIRSILANLSFDLRSEFGSLDPAKNRIPHSLCLHFIVRCDDGSVLFLLNERRKAYAGGTWSVSAEEQLKDSDLIESHVVVALFQRALLEEVFGLRDENTALSARWALVAEQVHSTRIWSLFLEEHINNFSLLGVCQLSASPRALRTRIQQFIDDGSGVRDPEGTIHIMSRDQIERLLIHGNATATGLFSDQSVSVLAENLHWTSRYRIFRLLRALIGGPLAPPTAT